MNSYTESQRKKGMWKFIIASLIGIFLFLTPLHVDGETSLPVAVLAGKFKELIGSFMPTLIYIIIIASILLTFYFSLTRSTKTPFIKNLFEVNWVWLLIRLLGGIFATIVYFNLNVPWINTENTGGLIYDGLLPTLITVFFFAGIFLPLLMDYGLFEFIGPMFSRIMRPLFTLPGRSAVENLASFVGDGTVGVMMASKQYDEGFYTRREATVIATSFSVVSITFAIVVAKEVDLMNHFFYFYFTVIVSCLVAAMITPRIWPLRQIADSYSNGSTKRLSEETPDTHNVISYGFENAVERGIKGPDAKGLLMLGTRTVMDMWFAVLPVVMCIGTIATIIAEYTNFFTWVGAPFVPILELMHVPEAVAASETILIGFADMFLPAILIVDVKSELTRFVVAALSISQLIYLSEVGGVILGSKIPVSLPKLFAIFMIRTIIILPIIVLMAHIIF
ncbi:YjiH family protein [Macrococcus lamae]|uniref:YjiH family protein n=1 Tax=Macrococcus lamae TaxID=198484 RepID=A0A4R6BTA5_9STAP|nr:YjiH family protein [Macrococcus lamae]TDM07881.1 YjiH family protein [Macrococcus lamae]